MKNKKVLDLFLIQLMDERLPMFKHRARAIEEKEIKNSLQISDDIWNKIYDLCSIMDGIKKLPNEEK